MTKSKDDQNFTQAENKVNQTTVDGKEEFPQIHPSVPLPNKPTSPAEPVEYPDPNSPEPGVNEPAKNDPTRIDEEPPIFNNY